MHASSTCEYVDISLASLEESSCINCNAVNPDDAASQSASSALKETGNAKRLHFSNSREACAWTIQLDCKKSQSCAGRFLKHLQHEGGRTHVIEIHIEIVALAAHE